MAFGRTKKKLMADDEVIVMNNVSKCYQAGVPALSNINLTIKKGEFVFVVGDSGSGKSTFIKLLLRELVPTEGSIYMLDYNLGKIKHRKIPKFRRNIGVVFQDFRLLKDRNVYENVAFAQRIIQEPGKNIRKNVPAVLSTVGLAGKYKAKPGKLSGGEQQRVAIARALIGNPDLILADEPTGNLDSKMTAEIMELFRKINKEEGKTILMVTHSPECAEYGTRTIVLEDGHVKG